MKILFFGDVFGRPGRTALKKHAPKLVERYNPDFVVANVENIAHGSGVTESTLNELEETGIFNAYTSGDHIWDTQKAKEILTGGKHTLIRPANYNNMPGAGHVVVRNGARQILVINLLGRVFMKHDVENPFKIVDEILSGYYMGETGEGERVDAILVDFHAEATAEKKALGFHLDGRVSAILGTHTHVPTADEQLLPKGSAYVSDVGMVGPYNSVIGLGKEAIVSQYVTGEKQKTDVSDENFVEIGAILVEISKNGLAEQVTHLRDIVKI
ncbi:MAG: TIGR00282 family metallophosphoesterase [Candidatus Spechtbacterales bacterium]